MKSFGDVLVASLIEVHGYSPEKAEYLVSEFPVTVATTVLLVPLLGTTMSALIRSCARALIKADVEAQTQYVRLLDRVNQSGGR